MAYGDVNSDGYTDFVTANLGPDGGARGNATVSLILSLNGPVYSVSSLPAMFKAHSVALSNIDSDNDLDLIAASVAVYDWQTGQWQPDNIWIWKNDGGTFTLHQRIINSQQSSPNYIATVDENGDGRIDYFVTPNNGPSDGTLSVWSNDGSGNFSLRSVTPVGRGPNHVSLADLNGDARSDAVVTNDTDNTISVLLGNGAGTFSLLANYAVGRDPRAVALRDLNGDAKPDVVVGNWAERSLTVLFGNGNGTFGVKSSFALTAPPTDIALKDLDQDGKVDISVSTSESNSVAVLYGNGRGEFRGRATYAVGRLPQTVAVVDFDRDGDRDLVTANGENTISLLKANRIRSHVVTTSVSTTADFHGLDFGTMTSPVNNVPVAGSDSYTLSEDGFISVSDANGLLANDLDVDGDSVGAVEYSPPLYGIVVARDDGSFSYSPSPNFAGTDSFTYRATDEFGHSTTTTVMLTVNGSPDPPVLYPIGGKVVGEGTTLRFNAAAFDPDLPGDDLTFAIDPGAPTATDADLPANALVFSLDAGAPAGSVINATTGVFTWTPTLDQGPGTYAITVRVTDNGAPPLGDFETIQVTVADSPPPQPGEIKGRAFEDVDGSGTFNTGEPLLAGATVFVDADSDGALDAGELSRSVRANGRYRIAQVAAGPQRVCLVAPAGFVAGCSVAEVPDGGIVTGVALPAFRPALIRARVQHDISRDGVLQPNEPPLANAILFLDANGNGAFDVGEPMGTTNAEGRVRFRDLAPGTYNVLQVPPPGFEQVFPAGGAGRTVVLQSGGQARANFRDDEPLAAGAAAARRRAAESVGGELDPYAAIDEFLARAF